MQDKEFIDAVGVLGEALSVMQSGFTREAVSMCSDYMVLGGGKNGKG